MEVTMRLTPEEKRSVKTFVSAQRRIEMGMTHACGVDVQIPDSLKTVKRDESIEDEDVSFLLYDSVEDTTKPRIVIFSSAAMRRIASTASEFFADGTYHIVPNGFATLYTIHAIVSGEVFPVFFCLMQNEKEVTFCRVFTVIKPHLSTLDKNTVVHTDCQLSAIKAIRKVFRCVIRLCLFHINQALWRMISKVGLACHYNDTSKPHLHAYIRLLMSLPFLPGEKIVPCFEYVFEQRALQDRIGVEPEFVSSFEKVVQYYKRFWIQKITPELWSLFDTANRTNNHAEAFHRWVGQSVCVAHPHPFILIQLLRDIEHQMVAHYARVRIGRGSRKTNKRMADLEHGIKSALMTYHRSSGRRRADFSQEIQLLSDVSKLYVHYYHEQKCARKMASVPLIKKSTAVKQAVLHVLEEQNKITFDIEEETETDGFVFVDGDIQSEIVFDSLDENASLFQTSEQATPHQANNSRHTEGPTRSAFGGRRRSTELLQGTKQSSRGHARKTIFDTLQRSKKPKLTLLQRMKRSRKRSPIS